MSRESLTERTLGFFGRPRLFLGCCAMSICAAFLQGCAPSGTSSEKTFFAKRVKAIDLSALAVPVYNSISFAMDCHGNIHIASLDDHLIVVIDTSGTVLRTIGAEGEGPGEFLRPTIVESAANCNIVVSDYAAFRVSLFQADGRFLRSVSVSMGPLLAWSGTFLCASSARPENLVDLYDGELRYLGGVGDGQMASIDERLGPGLLLEAYRDTVWILHWRRRPLLLTKWTRTGALLAKAEVTSPSMARNIALKDEIIVEESKKLRERGLIAGTGWWQHVASILRDPSGNLWFNYYWLDQPGKMRSIYYVFTADMHLIGKVEGFRGTTDSPHLDRERRLWVLERTQPDKAHASRLLLSVYRVRMLFAK